MKFDEIEKILKTSNPKDWLFNGDDEIYTYKPDIKLNIYTRDEDEPLSERKFDEDWVKKYPNKDAWKVIAKVYYSGAFVKSYLFVNVDGGRIIIGAPKSAEELKISHLQYNMGKILCYRNVDANLIGYDERLSISGIEVQKALLY